MEGEGDSFFLSVEGADVVVGGSTTSLSPSTQSPGKHIERESSVGTLLAEDHRGRSHNLLLVQPSAPPTHQLSSRHWSFNAGLRKMLQCGVP